MQRELLRMPTQNMTLTRGLFLCIKVMFLFL